jgi:hypothetical protein
MPPDTRVIVAGVLFGTCGVLGAAELADAFPEAATQIVSLVGVLALALVLILAVQ